VLFLNLLLFFVVAIPFATATIAAYLSQAGADASLADCRSGAWLRRRSIAATSMCWMK